MANPVGSNPGSHAGRTVFAAFKDADAGFAWRDPPYEYEAEKLPFDILAGSARLREQLDARVPVAEIARSWDEPVAAFEQLRSGCLLY